MAMGWAHPHMYDAYIVRESTLDVVSESAPHQSLVTGHSLAGRGYYR
jgi:hypothetical protein